MKKSQIEFDDYAKVDIRVGEIKHADPVVKSQKLLALQVDFGEDYGHVEILSGIAEFYQPDELLGKKCLFVANLAPRAMMGKTSNGMILAAGGEKPSLITVSSDIPAGTIIR
jgi:methionyl-tRNA synthetase